MELGNRNPPNLKQKKYDQSIYKAEVLAFLGYLFLDMERGALEQGSQQLVRIPGHRVSP